MKTRSNLRVTCAIILRDNLVLATQRSERMKMPLKWEFPGGKVESGERDEACLHRELQEELNISVRILQPLSEQRFSYSDFDITLVPFVVAFDEGEIQLAEHKAFRWVSFEELSTLDWAAADVPVVADFLTRINADKRPREN